MFTHFEWRIFEGRDMWICGGCWAKALGCPCHSSVQLAKEGKDFKEKVQATQDLRSRIAPSDVDRKPMAKDVSKIDVKKRIEANHAIASSPKRKYNNPQVHNANIYYEFPLVWSRPRVGICPQQAFKPARIINVRKQFKDRGKIWQTIKKASLQEKWRPRIMLFKAANHHPREDKSEGVSPEDRFEWETIPKQCQSAISCLSQKTMGNR